MTEIKTGDQKGRKGYSFVKERARRDKRRQEAEARQREYDGLTLEAKLARAKGKKEIAKLEKKLAKRNEKPVAKRHRRIPTPRSLPRLIMRVEFQAVRLASAPSPRPRARCAHPGRRASVRAPSA